MTRGPGIVRSPAPAASAASSEDPGLLAALAALNAAAKTKGEGAALWSALSAEARVPSKRLQKQRTVTRLNYGEILLANFLAGGSESSFQKIVSRHTALTSWSQLATELRVNPATLTARLNRATAAIKRL